MARLPLTGGPYPKLGRRFASLLRPIALTVQELPNDLAKRRTALSSQGKKSLFFRRPYLQNEAYFSLLIHGLRNVHSWYNRVKGTFGLSWIFFC